MVLFAAVHCRFLARTCRSKVSAHGSLSGDKRTIYAQREFFAFDRGWTRTAIGEPGEL